MNECSFLQDLAQRKFPLATLKKYLEIIKCQPALNIFEDASKLFVTTLLTSIHRPLCYGPSMLLLHHSAVYQTIKTSLDMQEIS